MGKHVVVKYTKYSSSLELRDLTLGSTYSAYSPDFGEYDRDGLPVVWADELWIDSDDSGDAVVTRIADLFTVVEL